MTVHIVVDNIAALLLPHAVGEHPDPCDVAARKEPQPILPRQPLTALDLLLNL